jgi:regulator of chromosome condensation
MKVKSKPEPMEVDRMDEIGEEDEAPGPAPGPSNGTLPRNTKLKRTGSLRTYSDSNNNRNSARLSMSKRRKVVDISVSHPQEKGTLFTFGQNETGQLGIENAAKRKFPACVEKMRDMKVTQVAAGAMHTIALTEDNKVYSFGCNDDLSLGRETEEEEDLPVPGLVPFKEKIVQITAGSSHSAALTDIGTVYFWGSFRNSGGDIGLQPGRGKVMAPTMLSFGDTKELQPKIIKIASGSHHLLALTSDGDVFALGDGECGQLGRYVTDRALRSRATVPRADAFLEPEKVNSPHLRYNVCDIWAGGHSTYCKTSDGDIWAFGLNASSQLGWASKKPRNQNEAIEFDNLKNCEFVPKKSSSFNTHTAKPWMAIAIGDNHALALSEEGKVFVLGDGRDGRLGLGPDKTEKSEPVLVPALQEEKCIHIACGGSTSYAVTASGKLYAWGFGESWQLGNGEEDDADIPTLCKSSRNEDGITGNVVYASAGSQHVAIITQLPPETNSQ